VACRIVAACGGTAVRGPPGSRSIAVRVILRSTHRVTSTARDQRTDQHVRVRDRLGRTSGPKDWNEEIVDECRRLQAAVHQMAKVEVGGSEVRVGILDELPAFLEVDGEREEGVDLLSRRKFLSSAADFTNGERSDYAFSGNRGAIRGSTSQACLQRASVRDTAASGRSDAWPHTWPVRCHQVPKPR
jgi:hypothetical protein